MYNSFKLLKKLYFVRTSGSKEELEAANILKTECENLGVNAELEEFEVDGYEIKKANISFSDEKLNFECCGVGQSSSTPLEGVTGEFAYVTGQEDADLNDLEGKICLINNKIIPVKLYKTLAEKKVKGIILCCGSVYDDKKDVDLDPYMIRENRYKYGKIPAVAIRMKDAEKLLRVMPKEATLTVIQDEFKNKSYNVVATIEGNDEKLKKEVIVFSAHYDSVSFSKGAYDNATGSTCIMQLLDYYQKHKPARTLKFIWCASEEVGLLGSIDYTNKHKEELKDYVLNINVDMIGVTLGKDIARVTANNSLVNYIKYLSKINAFPIEVNQGIYSSDSTPFADNGVPSLSFARISPAGGAVIHSRKDVIDFLSENNYFKTIEFIEKFSDSLVFAKCFPVEREIPDNIKEEIEKYFNRNLK